jgi:ferredoxin
MQVEVDRGKCVASGQCAVTAPTVFDQDDDEGKVVVLDAAPAPSAHDRARRAAGMCPGMAISLRDDQR